MQKNQNNNWIAFFKETLEKLVSFFLGVSITKNSAKENANELIKKAKKKTKKSNNKDN